MTNSRKMIFQDSLARVESRWPKQKQEGAAEVIVKILRVNKAMIAGSGNVKERNMIGPYLL